jgi:predicted nucleotidyltransferase
MVKNNGYVMEQIFSPLVVCGEDFLARLRPLARGCLTKFHYYHYRGFFSTQRQLLLKQQPRTVKSVLYAYRVLLTGIHLLRSGEVEANLVRLAHEYRLPFIADLIAQKKAEKIAAELDWPYHEGQLLELERRMEQTFVESQLPADRDRRAVHAFLVELRLLEAPA